MSWIAVPPASSCSRIAGAATDTIEPSMDAIACPVSSTASIRAEPRAEVRVVGMGRSMRAAAPPGLEEICG
ncbi:hypothetical protein Acsp03_03360 [Actinomadura sp. NBRC 104412]|nr:hypothetical protein Acsp03_03360 [Actinomadura sp. NBRC 104412]